MEELLYVIVFFILIIAIFYIIYDHSWRRRSENEISNKNKRLRNAKIAQAESEGLGMWWFWITINFRLFANAAGYIVSLFIYYIRYYISDIDEAALMLIAILCIFCSVMSLYTRHSLSHFYRSSIKLYFISIFAIQPICDILIALITEDIRLFGSSFSGILFCSISELVYYRKRSHLFDVDKPTKKVKCTDDDNSNTVKADFDILPEEAPEATLQPVLSYENAAPAKTIEKPSYQPVEAEKKQISLEPFANRQEYNDNNKISELKQHADGNKLDAKAIGEIFSVLGWNNWSELVHFSSKQMERLTKAVQAERMHIINYDSKTGIACVRGETGASYIVSRQGCQCEDFKQSYSPCKHMYFLAKYLFDDIVEKKEQKLKDDEYFD